MSSDPLVSFVATSRNDDHGGDVLRRTQSFVRYLALQAERHQVRCELILVDWNPPESRPALAEVLEWPAGSEWFTARVITAPRRLHAHLRHSSALSMFQMIAKNVGIRRATGRFIAATNIDIIFSDELFQWLKNTPLREGVLYRSDRWDIPNEVQLEPDFDELLAKARTSAIRRNLKQGTFVRKDGRWVNTTRDRVDDIMVHAVEWRLKTVEDALLGGRYSAEQAARDLKEFREHTLLERRRYLLVPLLHTNGCGDFTLMGRQTWGLLRAYPEWEIFSWAIDSVLLYQAHYSGIALVELPPDVTHYHIEHGHGSGWTPEGAQSLWARLQMKAIPCLDTDGFMEIVFDLEDSEKQGVIPVYNGLDWGFAREVLPEETTAAPDLPALEARAVNEGSLDEEFGSETKFKERAVPDDRVFTATDDVEYQRYRDADGRQIHWCKTLPQAWSYALGWSLPGVAPTRGELWLRVSYRTISGTFACGVINRDNTAMLCDLQAKPRSDGFTSILLRVPNGAEASVFMCRPVDAAGAQFEIADLRLLWREDEEDESVEVPSENWFDAALARMRPPAGGTAAPVSQPPPATAQGPEAVPEAAPVPEPAPTATDNVAEESALDVTWVDVSARTTWWPVAAAGEVRGASANSQTGLGGDEPLKVRIPSEPWGRAALLEPPPDGGASRAIRIDLRLAQGPLGIALLSADETTILREKLVDDQRGAKSVVLDVSGREPRGRILVRTADAGRSAEVEITGVWLGV